MKKVLNYSFGENFKFRAEKKQSNIQVIKFFDLTIPMNDKLIYMIYILNGEKHDY